MSRTKPDEDYALKHNKGIITNTTRMSLDEISVSFLGGFNSLLESQEPGSENGAKLAVLRQRFNAVGIIVPSFRESTHMFPIMKDDLLTLTGQIQMHSEEQSYNSHKRKCFKEIARLLREYLYFNYQLTHKEPKVTGPSPESGGDGESAENVPST